MIADPLTCCVCGLTANENQRLVVGLLKKQFCHPKAYCLKCWSETFPAIAEKQRLRPQKKKEVLVNKKHLEAGLDF